MKALVDNDILLKGACYGTLIELISVCCKPNEAGILGSARFIIPKGIQKNAPQGARKAALDVFKLFLLEARIVEPVEVELRMAADLELLAQRLGVSLDSGESQLCAVLCIRLIPWLLTGDKRAIVALEKLFDNDARLAHLAGRVMCLEQLVSVLGEREGASQVFAAIRREPQTDKALTNCVGSSGKSVRQICEGLHSYVNALRRSAPRVLFR